MTFAEHQADLDDLVSSCRSENARRAFAEAVACFRAGAYRAAIVSTWTSIVYDYLAKLRDLELAGNGVAKAILLAFDTARQNNDTMQLLSLERSVLDDAAAKFELLSPIEKQDLERLQLDRHRCAHPSLLTLDDPYRPTAELARSHMRNAVVHLLSRPPLQGQEAWKRIWSDVESEFFPETVEGAVERLRVRISRARTALVNRLVVELTKRLLDPSADRTADDRFFAALVAVTQLYHREVEDLLSKKLASLSDQVEDGKLTLLLRYVARYEMAWPHVGVASQGRLRTFVERTDSVYRLGYATKVAELRTVVVGRLGALSHANLSELTVATRMSECIDEVLLRFETTSSYKAIAALRPPLREEEAWPMWSKAQIARLTRALESNSSLRAYLGFAEMACEVLRLSGSTAKDFEADWKVVYSRLLDEGSYHAVGRIREVFPTFPAPPDQSAAAPNAVEPSAAGA